MKGWLVLLLTGLALMACSKEEKRASSPPAPVASAAAVLPDPAVARRRGIDPTRAEQGARLFAAHCAACHGSRAEGTPNWRTPGADGKYPPPPLDGSAHAWHHPRAILRLTIREGTGRLGGNMPAFRDKLSEGDIEAIIDWLVARWPDAVYAQWLEIERNAR
ncbi:c-type cytochrome [Thiobacter aerophilum]|uniref:Cytochrome c n=1 Tax=Thiobacter aerophilum TaxID=3121275 RepID=A0ABV0EDR9_9BURK